MGEGEQRKTEQPVPGRLVVVAALILPAGLTCERRCAAARRAFSWSGDQLEGVAVSGPHDSEVTVVECHDRGHAEAFRHGDH